MTWSIVARDPASGAFGVAVATRFFAVGALCAHADGGVGALATQALINPTYGPRGLRLLREGGPAQTVVDVLTGADPGAAARQLHVQDAQGRIAAFTGAQCVPWCGHAVHDGFSVAGNMLAGPEVIERTAGAYRDALSLPFARRLIAALRAGEAAGGDKRNIRCWTCGWTTTRIRSPSSSGSRRRSASASCTSRSSSPPASGPAACGTARRSTPGSRGPPPIRTAELRRPKPHARSAPIRPFPPETPSSHR